MKAESMELTGTRNPNVYVSTGDLQEEDYVNAAVDSELNQRSSPTRRQKIIDWNPSIKRSLSTVAICWVILVIITGLRIHYTVVVSAKLKDFQDVNRRLRENVQELQADLWRLQKQETSTKDWRKLSFEWTTTAMPKAKHYHTTTQPCHWGYFYRTMPHPYYVRKKRQTKPCQRGWLHFQFSCYKISSQNDLDQKTWDEARDDCRLRDADLVVVGTPEEQDFIYKISLAAAGASCYWIGLRAEGGGWKWLNGNELTNGYWLQPPAEGLSCATSVKEASGWKSVSCDDKNGWICQQKAQPA
uniref:C-type lectin domain-containing protein n=1 Tax=Poecilia mexicana TaxID=48701 RepID=A0A3B3WE08_9TELE